MSAIKNIAVLVGSTAKDSLNQKLAHALASMSSDETRFVMIKIDHLPIYNRDRDTDPPAEWVAFREQVKACDGVLWVTPEHNRSYSALIHNALEIGSRPYGHNIFDSKPTAVVGTSPGSIGAALGHYHLSQSLLYLNMKVLGQPEVFLSAGHTAFEEDGSIANEGTAKFLKGFLTAFEAHVRNS